MSRNLTERSPHAEGTSSDSSEPADPFTYELQSYEESTHSAGSRVRQGAGSGAGSGGARGAGETQQLLFPENTSSVSVLNPFSSTHNLSQGAGVGAGVGAGAGFAGSAGSASSAGGAVGRYPQGLSSRVASLQSLGSKSTSTAQGNYSSSSSRSSDKSSSPFVVDTDFSPFGGYPASSFPLHIDEKEDDDYLHNPDPIADADYDKNRFWYDMKSLDRRSAWGLGGVIFFGIGLLTLLVVLPVLTYSGATNHPHYVPETYTRLSEYAYPRLSAIRTSLIDPDTPADVMTRRALDGSQWSLVFSDEFAAEGRTFYEGDDQFFYAPDFHYQATTDLEWYDPDAVTTQNGTLTMRLDAFPNHNLFYRSGMLHSWNQLCFTQGALEVTAMLPSLGNVTGLWPGMWAMGNLGRPGYMATTDGVWPYSYEECDAGITPNQSSPDGISYLPGQRLNSCTCSGGDHPNQGTGRGAPEIDIIEGEVDTTIKNGVASQSLQVAPMDIWYMPDYNWVEVYNRSVTAMNTYAGGPFQQAVSATTTLNTNWYEKGDTDHQFQRYSFEYLNDNNNGYVSWYVGSNASWTMHANALAPNGNIGWRRISKEPMSIVANLGISNNWAYIDWPGLEFPFNMRIDAIRIYQPNDSVSVTCDPVDYPTYDYIEAHPRAYQVWNNTHWGKVTAGAGYDWPSNRLNGGC